MTFKLYVKLLIVCNKPYVSRQDYSTVEYRVYGSQVLSHKKKGCLGDGVPTRSTFHRRHNAWDIPHVVYIKYYVATTSGGCPCSWIIQYLLRAYLRVRKYTVRTSHSVGTYLLLSLSLYFVERAREMRRR